MLAVCMLSKHDKVRRSLECPVEGSIVAEHQWSQINFPISCRQFENLLQVVVNFSVCRFFLAKELWKPTSGLGIQFHRFVQLDRDFVAEFFFSIYDDFVGTPYRQIHLAKIAFATVSAVLSEMATNSAYFETASVKLKMYLLLLPEATGAAIMSKCTR